MFCERSFQRIDLNAASVHDIHYLKDIQHQMSDCVLVGDRDYLSATVNIYLEIPKRKNQKYISLNFMYSKRNEKILNSILITLLPIHD